MQGNPTGCMGLADYLGWKWKSKAGLPIVNVPGCPVQPDNFTETLLYLLYQAAGLAPMIPLDDYLRPKWLFGATVHHGCDRAGYYEEGDFTQEYGKPECLVKIGCWGPVVDCNVTKRGWMAGIGGCPNVGGICIACTMPGFPDKFMPFMDEPPGAHGCPRAGSSSTARVIRALRSITHHTANKEPKWRHPGRASHHRVSTFNVLSRGGAQHGEQITQTHNGRQQPPAKTRRDELGPDHPHRREAWASTPRSISRIIRWPSATARPRSFAATASS